MIDLKEGEPSTDAPNDLDTKLAHIEAVSRNARGTWLSLIALLLFSAIAVAGVRDRDYFTFGSSLVLPIIGVSVPIKSFFYAGPVIVLGLYTYLHLYLTKLWRALAEVDAEIQTKQAPNRFLDDLVFPWLVSDAAIYIKPGAPKRPFSGLTQLVSFLFLWLAAPLVLLFYWIRSFPPHDLMLTSWIGFLTGASLVGCVLSFGFYWRTLRPNNGERSSLDRDIAGLAVFVTVVLSGAILCLGVLRTVGTLERHLVLFKTDENNRHAGPLSNLKLSLSFGRDDWIYGANLFRADIVERPANWQPYEEALEEFKANYSGVKRKDFGLDRHAGAAWLVEAEKAFKKRRENLLASLRANDFPGASLRGANLREAYMPGLDLRGADLRNTNLTSITAEAADLTFADLREAALWWAALPAANLQEAKLHRVDLRGADLQRADLRNVNLQGAYLRWANLERANLRWAILQDAILLDANLQGTDLRGADLRGADLRAAYTRNTRFQLASLVSVDLTMTDIAQHQIDLAYGDGSTQLPEGMTPPEHWPSEVIPGDEVEPRWQAWVADQI